MEEVPSQLMASGPMCLTCVVRPAPAPAQRPSDFSIDHILHRAGPKRTRGHEEEESQIYDWLSCTRYRPPKLQRSKKKDGCSRRKLGRNPRIPFSAAQVEVLEDKFRSSPYLSTSDVSHLSTLLRLSDTRIKIWFQNRRARERRDHGKIGQSPPPREQHPSGSLKSAFTPTSPSHSHQQPRGSQQQHGPAEEVRLMRVSLGLEHRGLSNFV